MSGARRARLAIAALIGAFAGGCHRSAAGDNPAAASTDSLQGTVRITGVDALPRVTLAFDDGTPSVTLVGAPSLRQVAGLRVSVVGARAGSQMTVSRFTVVAANGVPATDGVLSIDGTALILTTADGRRHTLVSPSPALRAAAGHRVWVSGPLTAPPVAYGVID